MQPIKIVRLTASTYIPFRATDGSAGLDLMAPHDCVVPPMGKKQIFLDVAIKVPNGSYGRIAARSGLAWNHHISVAGGVIDPDYRGNVGVVLFNHSQDTFPIRSGDKIAQLLVEDIKMCEVLQVRTLSTTARGPLGFGSSGRGMCRVDRRMNSERYAFLERRGLINDSVWHPKNASANLNDPLEELLIEAPITEAYMNGTESRNGKRIVTRKGKRGGKAKNISFTKLRQPILASGEVEGDKAEADQIPQDEVDLSASSTSTPILCEKHAKEYVSKEQEGTKEPEEETKEEIDAEAETQPML